MLTLSRAEPASLARRYLDTHGFKELYAELMALVERTADYLDGNGRKERTYLSAREETLYARASMQLTTQLMQMASHALMMKDVAEKRMGFAEAMGYVCEKRVHLTARNDVEGMVGLPGTLVEISEMANQIRSRITFLHDGLTRADEETVATPNPVHNHLQSLYQAFA